MLLAADVIERYIVLRAAFVHNMAFRSAEIGHQAVRRFSELTKRGGVFTVEARTAKVCGVQGLESCVV